MLTYNACVSYSKITNATKIAIVFFRLNIAEELLQKKNTLSNYKTRGRPVSSYIPKRLQAKNWAHFPEYILPTKSKERQQERSTKLRIILPGSSKNSKHHNIYQSILKRITRFKIINNLLFITITIVYLF